MIVLVSEEKVVLFSRGAKRRRIDRRRSPERGQQTGGTILDRRIIARLIVVGRSTVHIRIVPERL